MFPRALRWRKTLRSWRRVVLVAALGGLALPGSGTGAAAEAGNRFLFGIEALKVPGRDYYRPHDAFRTTQYDGRLFLTHLADVPLDVAGIYGATAIIGITHWGWGNDGFHFHSEGWFGKHTGSGGIDKLGHAFTSALISDFLTDRIRMASSRPEGAAITAGLLSFGVMSAIEVFDGYASDHGFSYEDMIVDTAGILFSVARNAIPGLREKIDFRQEYFPQAVDHGFHPFLAYEGKRFLLALKLSGFDAFRDTPLRYVEIQAGYYARGFSTAARRAGVRKRRVPFIGIGINLNELFLGPYERDEHTLKWGARFALEHFQVPFNSLSTAPGYYRRR